MAAEGDADTRERASKSIYIHIKNLIENELDNDRPSLRAYGDIRHLINTNRNRIRPENLIKLDHLLEKLRVKIPKPPPPRDPPPPHRPPPPPRPDNDNNQPPNAYSHGGYIINLDQPLPYLSMIMKGRC